MKLSKYIKSLQDILDAHGDIHCIRYEGNRLDNLSQHPVMRKTLAYNNGYNLIFPHYNNGYNLIFPHQEEYHELGDSIRFDLVKTCLC